MDTDTNEKQSLTLKEIWALPDIVRNIRMTSRDIHVSKNRINANDKSVSTKRDLSNK